MPQLACSLSCLCILTMLQLWGLAKLEHKDAMFLHLLVSACLTPSKLRTYNAQNIANTVRAWDAFILPHEELRCLRLRSI